MHEEPAAYFSFLFRLWTHDKLLHSNDITKMNDTRFMTTKFSHNVKMS